MNKRDLFVFCGQSNMMGAPALPPKHILDIKESVEFKFKKEYLGIGSGEFKKVSYDCGEFLYCDNSKAYPGNNEKSSLNNYSQNTFFVPSIANFDKEFSNYSENDYISGSCVLPYFCENYEKMGESPITAHIAKGGVPIIHYFNDEMAKKYNEAKAFSHKELVLTPMQTGANRVFTEKCLAMFREADLKFKNQLGKKIFVWLQGESDANDSESEYRLKLEILYDYIKKIGFDYFFCIRVGYWGDPNIINIIRAQEHFCSEKDDCFMVSRRVSFMPDIVFKTPQGWFKHEPDSKYLNCRDTYAGYNNMHINEKGFILVAEELAKNAYLILKENREPVLDEELLSGV